MMIKKLITIIFSVIFSMFLIFFILHEYKSYTESKTYKENASPLINFIENYRNKHGKVPDNLSLIKGDTIMGEGPYYLKLNETDYLLYFVVGFDTYFVYSSISQQWTFKKNLIVNE